MIRRSMSLVLALVVLSSLARFANSEESPAGSPPGYKLIYSQDCSQPDALKSFVMTDAEAWKLSSGPDGKAGALELTRQSKYGPVHRSPANIALIGGQKFGDCVIDVECQQTGKEYGHRDMIFVFGFQSPEKYYYTHIATKTDDHANQIFIVNDAPRLKISTESTEGTDWGQGQKWHHVRLVRKVSDGTINVFFDDMSKPIMKAVDKTFGAGWIGFGSFDDTGKVANIKVWGESSEQAQAPTFPKREPEKKKSSKKK